MRNNIDSFKEYQDKIDMSNLRKLRTEKGISPVKLSHLAGTSLSAIESYQSNNRIPSLPIAYKLADIFQTSIDYIAGRNHELNDYYLLSEEDKKKVIKYITELLKNS